MGRIGRRIPRTGRLYLTGILQILTCIQFFILIQCCHTCQISSCRFSHHTKFFTVNPISFCICTKISDCCLDITQLHRMRSLVGCPVLYAGNNKPFLRQCAQICQMRCFVHALPCATANPYNTWICLSFPVLRIDEIQFEISPAMTEPGINLRISNVCCHNILWFCGFRF